MTGRDDILARVRKSQPGQPAPQPLPAVPTFDTDIGSPLGAVKACS